LFLVFLFAIQVIDLHQKLSVSADVDRQKKIAKIGNLLWELAF